MLSISLWSRNGTVKPLSGDLRKSLKQHNFQIEAEQLARLRCISKSGQMRGRNVRSIRIFDPARLVDTGLLVESYDDLDKAGQGVVAEGYTQGGTTYLYRPGSR